MKFLLGNNDPAGLKVGGHGHEGRNYKHGDVIESDRDLVALYANKFLRVPDDTPVTDPATRPLIPLICAPASDTAASAAPAKRAPQRA